MNLLGLKASAGRRLAIPLAMFLAVSSAFLATSAHLPVLAAGQSWSQDGHDAQRTGANDQSPTEPWNLLWTWNGPDSSGGTGNHAYNAPKEARTVAGGGFIFVPAGSQGLYALNEQTGARAWHITPTSFNAAPAYDPVTGDVYAGGADGKLYQINAQTGAVVATLVVGNPLNTGILLVGSYVYATSSAGQLVKVATANLTAAWTYSSGGGWATEPAYSSSRDAIVFATDDLYVQAINNTNGSLKWRVKPTQHTPGWPYQWDNGWPVIAEKHGIVFVRLQLSQNSLSQFGVGPTDMGSIRTWLQNNPLEQNLFALSLDAGSTAFIPAVAYGSTEDYVSGSAYGVIGQMPVVKTWPNGDEVAYITFRSGQGNPPDYRWNGHLGEMVLDGTTVSGMNPGDLRYTNMETNTYVYIIDEENPLTILGDTIFHAHWGALENGQITNRATSLGGSLATPISVSNHPFIIRRQGNDSNPDNTTRYTTSGLYLYQDGRMWQGPGYWTYWNTVDPSLNVPPNPPGSRGFEPRYAYTSDGYLVSEGSGGELMVFNTANQPTPTPTPNLQYTVSLSIEK